MRKPPYSMTDLRELLEVLYRAHERVTTLVAEYRDWSCPRPSYELIVARSNLGAPRPRWRGSGPYPKESVFARRIWYENPGRLRIDVLRNTRLVRLGVRDHSDWWRWDEVDGATAGDAQSVQGRPLLPPLLDPPLLDPVRLIPALRLEPAGQGVRAGREVMLARAWPREAPLTRGVLSYELEFDAEHGTTLRRAAFEDGWCFQVTEALKVLYGSPIDAERFVFVSPDGRPARRFEPFATAANGMELPVTVPRHAATNGSGVPLAPSRHLAGTIWLTGLPAAGKTTLASAVKHQLMAGGYFSCVLDGDALRRGLSSDLGLSPADRGEQARRAAHVAALIASGGAVAIVALVSPYTEDRQRARQIHDELAIPFVEVWVDTSLAVCQQRDPGGLYARARTGELRGLTGVDAPYEPPEAPELRVADHDEDPQEVAMQIVKLLAA